MNITNYMSALVSEVQEFGRAYVDSLVSPDDGEGEIKRVIGGDARGTGSAASSFAREIGGEPRTVATTSNKRKNSASGNIRSASSSTGRLFHCRTIEAENHDDEEDLSHRSRAGPQIPPETFISRTIGSGSSSGAMLQGGRQHCEGSAMDRQFSSLMTHATSETTKRDTEVVATRLQRAPGNKGKLLRSKFGAVKIVAGSDGALEAPHAVTPEACPVLAQPQSFGSVPSINAKDDGNTSGKVRCQHVQQKEVAKAAGSLSSVTEPWNWSRKKHVILNLLRSTVVRRAAAPGEIPVGVRRAICRFSEEVVTRTILSVVDDCDKNGVNSEMMILTTSSSTDAFFSSMWCDAEATLGCSVRCAISQEVLEPGYSSYDENTAAAAKSCLVLAGKLVPTPFQEVLKLQQAFHDVLKVVRQWHDDRRLHSFFGVRMSVPSSSSSSKNAPECVILEFLSMCYSPLVRVAAEQCHRNEPRSLKPELELSLLKEWGKEVMLAFCSTISEVDAESCRLAFSATSSDAVMSVDAAENAIRNATAALWLMCEATVVTLLVVWALNSSVS